MQACLTAMAAVGLPDDSGVFVQPSHGIGARALPGQHSPIAEGMLGYGAILCIWSQVCSHAGKNKKSLTLDPAMAEIYTDLCRNHLSTRRHLDEVAHLIQGASV
jgi:hypothetical protein